MASIQQIFKTGFDEYKVKNPVSSHQDGIVKDIINCRTEKMGLRILECGECGYEESTYCSCRNRNCPQCQTYVKEVWINDRRLELINTQYFHAVFTVPKELETITLSNQEIMLKILFKTVSEVLTELAKDPKYLGAQIGAILLLHTWSQNLMYHPHLHCLIPGGGLQNSKWVYCKEDFFVPVKVLSKKFRGKFLYYFEEAYHNGKLNFYGEDKFLYEVHNFKNLKNQLYNKSWYTYCKETFSSPDDVIEYLGRYTHRIAISNSRIVKVEDGHVWFRWRDNKDNGKQKIMKITVEEFIRRYLLHVLPKGFVKIRYIGIWGNRNKKTKLKMCQIYTKINLNKIKFRKLTKEMLLMKITKGKAFKCPCCGSDKFKLIGINKTITNENNSS